jgi:rSAM/selenodomain-associated transferase 1
VVSQTAHDVVVVMAKAPIPGTVKTRLAAVLGPERACDLYRAFLGDVAAKLARGPWQLVWAVTPAGSDLTAELGTGCVQIAQRGDTLGERMAACFADLFAAGASRVMMVGADAPHLDANAIADGLASLAVHDAVFVPARDGGYCAVGLREFHDIFTPVVMGRADVFARTCDQLAALGLTWRVLPSTFDIDELADVVDLARLLDTGVVSLSRTAEVLHSWRREGVFSR